MTPSMPSTTTVSRQGDLQAQSRAADLVMLFSLACQGAAALAIGQYHGQAGLAMVGSAALLALGLSTIVLGRGTALAWMGLTTSNVAFVALHIQLGRGTIEFHFGVFVLLGLLLVYRDWRPIVLAAGLFAVHHLGFDRLQAMNWGVYCTPEPNFLKVLMHAAYLVVQTAVECVLALRLKRAAVESAELIDIVRHIDRGARLSLDVSGLASTSPTPTLLKQVLAKMSDAMSEVRTAATSIERACTDIAAGNLDLSKRTEIQASNLQQTAASMEELTGSVRSAASSASQATLLAGAASAAAVQGGAAVGAVVATMDSISQSSRRIADINAVIDGIAFQTNILALNAAVEAARAGEHGRGFAVVASEVRLLAQRSANAAKEIKSLIGDSVQKVELGTEQVGAAGSDMDNIVSQTEMVSHLIHEISQSAGQQATGISQVGEAVSQLDTVTQQNAALVEQSAAAAESMKHQAQHLIGVVNRFELLAKGRGA